MVIDSRQVRAGRRQLLALIGTSATGDGITRTILPLAAAATPHAPVVVGVVQAAARLPWLLVSLPAGRAVDRNGTAPAQRLGLTLKLLGLTTLAVAVLTGWWALIVVAALVAVSGEVIFETATQTRVVHDFPEVQRPPINSMLQATQASMGQFIGPALAGVAYAVAPVVALTTAGGTQVAAATTLRRTPGNRRKPTRSSRMGAGFSALWSSPGLRATTVVGAVSMAAYGLWTATFVLYVTGDDGLGSGSAIFGLLVGCPALGSLLGAAVVPRILSKVTALGCLAMMIVGQLGLFLPPAAGAGTALVASGLGAYGFGLAGWNTGVLSFRQASVPSDNYGRVTAAYRFVSWGASPAGAVLGGALAASTGVQTAMLAGAAIVAAQVPLLWWARSLAHYRGGVR